MNRLTYIVTVTAVLLLFQSCANNNLIDNNMSLPDNNWTYAKSLKSSFEVKDIASTYQVHFKLRHTADYRYSNLYVLAHIKGPGINKHTRYQFKVAKQNGEWLGKGSGDIFTYDFPLLTQFHFPQSGTYTIEIEQNMRDNPLIGISDVGLTVFSEEK